MVRSLDRTASSTGSRKVGMLMPGTHVEVLEESTTGDGVRRVRIDKGWCSTVSASGKVFLRPATTRGGEITGLKPEPEGMPRTRRSASGVVASQRFQASEPQFISREKLACTTHHTPATPRGSIRRSNSREGAPEPQPTASGGADLPAAARGLKKLDGKHHAPITCCSFGQMRELCTVSWDKTATISDADTGQRQYTLPQLHTDGRTLARGAALEHRA